jgi:hypothetical protein
MDNQNQWLSEDDGLNSDYTDESIQDSLEKIGFDHVASAYVVEEINRALLPIAKRFGLGLKRFGARYSSGVFPLPFALVLPKGKLANPRAAHDFQALAISYGLSPGDLGREIVIAGKKYKLVGVYPNDRKEPILAMHDGQLYRMDAASVRALLAAQDALAEIEGEENGTETKTKAEALDDDPGRKASQDGTG